MSWSEACLGFVRKYGTAARGVASAVLNVVAPGSAALVGLVGTACEAAQEAAEGHFEERLLQTVQNNGAELVRLGELFALLQGDLARLCEKAHEEAEVTHQTIEIEASVRKALARDPGLVQSLHKLDALTSRFDCLEDQNRRLLAGQDEMLPILRRLNRVADFIDECVQAGLTPRDLADSLRQRQEAVADIQRGRPQPARTQVVALEDRLPTSATVHVLAAGAAVVAGDYPDVQSELGKAAHLRPHDAEIGELHRRATVMATSAKVGTSRHPQPTPTATPARLQVGDVLDGWALEARLGAGGWGQVFRARRGNEVTALKVMHPEYSADERFFERFREEIATLFRLPRHDNLVRIKTFNKSSERGCWYLVMDHIDGPTLEQYLAQKGALTPALIREVFGPVAEGLGAAHSVGIAHRDIKPGNLVFRRSDQRLVLVDFGLAVHTADAGQTKIGGLTLQFAAPEQITGVPANERSDVYSLAATMYFALLYDQPALRNPRLFDADHVPEELRAMLERAMHTNPAKRPANGRELLASLTGSTGVATAVPVSPPPTETSAQRVRRMKVEMETLHAEVRALLELYDYEGAAAVMMGFPPELESLRDAGLLQSVVMTRDELRRLDEQIQSRLDSVDPYDQVLPKLLNAYLKLKPNRSDYAELAEVYHLPAAGKTVLMNSVGMKFAYIPPGTFQMGSPNSETGRSDNETLHTVTLTEPYYLGVYPVTVSEFEKFVQATEYRTEAETKGGGFGLVEGSWKQNAKINWRTPGFVQTPRHPVVCVSWNDAKSMVAWLNTIEANSGLVYFLPTEAQWEYACRAGTQTAYFWDDDKNQLGDYAWFVDNSESRTHPVETKKPNRWGLWHMSGNVYEWCEDWDGPYPSGTVRDPKGGEPQYLARVRRGGSWRHDAKRCRSASRDAYFPYSCVTFDGFRVAVSFKPGL